MVKKKKKKKKTLAEQRSAWRKRLAKEYPDKTFEEILRK